MPQKSKTKWFCKNCGTEYAKWMGRCTACGEWDCIIEAPASSGKSKVPAFASRTSGGAVPSRLSGVEALSDERIDTTDSELNRVLGGGLMKSSIILLGGEPGIGKSTLSLQTALSMKDSCVLYVSGEESLAQIKNRADRIGVDCGNCLFYTETRLEDIIAAADDAKPDLVFIDSIQTLYSDNIDAPAGSLSQIRECASVLLRYAKTSGTTIILIGHITKDGTLAGPKILEHIVDVVLQFEGDNHFIYRMLRPLKNRFGSTSELGIYQMNEQGLRQVTNPSEMLIGNRDENFSGISVGCSLDGIRPFLIECQALVSTAAYGTPQRSCTGYDTRRVNMLLAVLEKRAAFRLSAKDVFLNMAGGLKIYDPSMDLAVIAAIMSSNLDIPIPGGYCFSGEVSLSGEIRPVQRFEQRVAEAEKTGFSKIFASVQNVKNLDTSKFRIEIEGVSKVNELVSRLLK